MDFYVTKGAVLRGRFHVEQHFYWRLNTAKTSFETNSYPRYNVHSGLSISTMDSYTYRILFDSPVFNSLSVHTLPFPHYAIFAFEFNILF